MSKKRKKIKKQKYVQCTCLEKREVSKNFNVMRKQRNIQIIEIMCKDGRKCLKIEKLTNN